MHRLALLCLLLPTIAFAQARTIKLEYAPSPIDNPLKGLVPYAGQKKDAFPHSMEFNYLSYGSLVKGYEEFDWQPLEDLLNAAAQRGKQAIFRIYLEYPKKKNVIPDFLVKEGLKVHQYLNTNTQPFPPAEIETPDYEDPRLRRSLKNFIAAFGRKYDGDPRIGFITAGLLGTWGEWHTYPRSELFASRIVQQEVLDAYEAAFQRTPVLLRYPRAEKNYTNDAPNAKRRFGYHDDSFAWATLHTGRKNDDWFYMTALQKAGAMDKWKLHPIGGEIRPEAWGKVFDKEPGDKQIQNFDECVKATHATWLMDSGMFQGKHSPERIARATESVRKMGYDFQVTEATLDTPQPGQVTVEWRTTNRGIAPLYHRWKLELGLLADGKEHLVREHQGRLTDLLPGQRRTLTDTIDVKALKPGKYQVAVRIRNPMPTGKPIRFANKTQDQHLPGWLTLGEVEIK